jgi:hypothetical protein
MNLKQWKKDERIRWRAKMVGDLLWDSTIYQPNSAVYQRAKETLERLPLQRLEWLWLVLYGPNGRPKGGTR